MNDRPTEGQWGRSVRGGVVWSTVTFVGSKGLTFVTLVVLARILVPADFGVVAAIATFVAFLQLGATLGLRATMVYEQEKGVTPRVQTAFTLNLLLVSAFTGAGLLAAPLIAQFFGVPNEVGLFRLGVLSLLLVGLGNVHDGLLLRELQFNRRIIPELARGLVSGIVSVILALLGFGATSLVIGLLGGSAAWTACQWALTRFRPTLSLDRGVARSMLAYGLGASLLEIVAVLSQRTDTAVVGHILGERALGLYTIGYRVPELVIANVAWNVSLVAFPALARKRATEYEVGLASGALQLLRYQALYALPVAAGLAVMATPLVVVVFSARWVEAGGVMSALAVMMGISAMLFPLGDVFKATGRQRVLITLNLCLLPVLVVSIILAASQGILTVAWLRAAVMAAFAVLFLTAVRRELELPVRDIVTPLRPALAATAGVLVGCGLVRLVWSAHELGPIVAGALAGGVCGAAALRLVSPGTAKEVREMLPLSLRLGGLLRSPSVRGRSEPERSHPSSAAEQSVGVGAHVPRAESEPGENQ